MCTVIHAAHLCITCAPHSQEKILIAILRGYRWGGASHPQRQGMHRTTFPPPRAGRFGTGDETAYIRGESSTTTHGNQGVTVLLAPPPLRYPRSKGHHSKAVTSVPMPPPATLFLWPRPSSTLPSPSPTHSPPPKAHARPGASTQAFGY